MSEASRMAEKYEKFEDLDRYNAKWAAKFKRLREAKRAQEEFEALQCRSRLRRPAASVKPDVPGRRLMPSLAPEKAVWQIPLTKSPLVHLAVVAMSYNLGNLPQLPNKANANFSNRSEHKRSKPDASTSTSPSSAVRQRVLSGTRIPPKTSTYIQNIVPDLLMHPLPYRTCSWTKHQRPASSWEFYYSIWRLPQDGLVVLEGHMTKGYIGDWDIWCLVL
ncbi:uncharacterized protein PAC_06028 [Phialocephala subalpina]|uniref:Uncharacterized protein n=1 Tax=Phialocephala subalpina TaxID=576137 RepID=A0A1L7WTP7_9HELO|nr:uncharacterized protein PAC_06028 [Phialocephala subalpina]